MVSVIATAEPPIAPHAIGTDFSDAGFDVMLCDEASERLFQTVMRNTPDLIVVVSPTPSDMLLNCAALIKGPSENR